MEGSVPDGKGDAMQKRLRLFPHRRSVLKVVVRRILPSVAAAAAIRSQPDARQRAAVRARHRCTAVVFVAVTQLVISIHPPQARIGSKSVDLTTTERDNATDSISYLSGGRIVESSSLRIPSFRHLRDFLSSFFYLIFISFRRDTQTHTHTR